MMKMTDQDLTYIKDLFLRLQRSLERAYVPAVYQMLRRQLKAAAGLLERYGVEQVLSSLDKIITPDSIAEIFKAIWKEGAVSNAQTMFNILSSKPIRMRTLGYNEAWTRETMRFLNVHGIKRITQITQTTKDEIRETLQEGIKEGYGTEKIASQLSDLRMARWRSRLIVRTESVGAMNFGSMMGAAKTGLAMNKRWIATEDNKTRPTHSIADGQIVEFEKKFTVGGEGLAFPGDPAGSPDEICNCRCVVAFEPIRDRAGSLIPRPQIADNFLIIA